MSMPFRSSQQSGETTNRTQPVGMLQDLRSITENLLILTVLILVFQVVQFFDL